MKYLKTTALTLAFLFSSFSFSSEAPEYKAAEQLLSEIEMESVFTKIISDTLQLEVDRNPQMRPYQDVMEQFLRKYLSYNSLKSEMIEIYASEFTAAELHELTAFYKSDLGKKSIQKMPSLMQKGSQLGMQRLQQNAHELEKMIKEEQERILSATEY